ncbi:LOW QUALITY PROTEIN: membrane-spanning 4-domains subfamily A member 6A-like [Zalophus californianus]|uniref:LOW QUALITY PROTEIN: membrane-spanning 4-domains subfamily A member 6A-like n=1 Tax=Zalophus californianus TaxID=9704 RepID=A0A6J2C0C1_ZALCA|nr:LOW QUALITY PROTEIN: membrane-spanning 4-domains subfamily A member 6A-like [Zalophus californianus]
MVPSYHSHGQSDHHSSDTKRHQFPPNRGTQTHQPEARQPRETSKGRCQSSWDHPDPVWGDGVEFGNYFGVCSFLSTIYPDAFHPVEGYSPIRRSLVCEFVISGILPVIMEKKSTKPLAQSSVAANILSSLCALVGFILLSGNLAALDSAFWKCDLNREDRVPKGYSLFHYLHPYAKDDCFTAKTTLAGTLSVMLICTVLEFCMATLAAVVWWKQAYSDFAGSVLFLPQSYKNKSSIPAKAFSDPGYEELLTS